MREVRPINTGKADNPLNRSTQTGVEPLLNWILNYFSGGEPRPKNTTVSEALRAARPVVVTDKLPIVLQHEGHSRTIVGCEQVKGGALNLLTFDPSK